MTIDEFYNEFNLTYNNLTSNQAPGLDKYEISVYLTKAEEALVDALYSEYEQSESNRRKLANLVKTEKLSIADVAIDNIIYPEYTKVYKVPTDVRYIINEQVKMKSSADKCIAGTYLKVQPCLHDEIDTIIRNPFKFNIRRALRLDVSYENRPYIEILSKDKNIEYYQIRYIENPNPIILDVFEEAINGVSNTTSTGSLPDTTHRQIVEIAAKLAYNDYKN